MPSRNLAVVCSLIASLGLAATPAQASDSAQTPIPNTSELEFRIGRLPDVTIRNQEGYINVVLTQDILGLGEWGLNVLLENPHGSSEDPLFQTSNYVIDSSPFTGYPTLTRLTVNVRSGSGGESYQYYGTSWGTNNSFATPNPLNTVQGTSGNSTLCCSGGYAPLSGNAILHAMGNDPVSVPLTIVGGVPGMDAATAAGVVITGAPFQTGPAQITDITTILVSVPVRGGITGAPFTLNLTTVEALSAMTLTTAGVPRTTSVVTVTGSKLLNGSSQPAAIRLVAPFRIDTSGLGNGKLPGMAEKRYVFAPEPGLTLSLAAGIATLLALARKKMR